MTTIAMMKNTNPKNRQKKLSTSLKLKVLRCRRISRRPRRRYRRLRVRSRRLIRKKKRKKRQSPVEERSGIYSMMMMEVKRSIDHKLQQM